MNITEILEGDITDIEIPLGGLILISEKKLKPLEAVLSNYMQKHILPKIPANNIVQKIYEELKELELPIFEIPKSTIIRYARVGHALATLIIEECYNLPIPVYPWAIPLADDQDLSNYDALFFDAFENLWLVEAKTSLTTRGLSNQISQLLTTIKGQTIPFFFRKAMLFQRHYSDKIDKVNVMKAFKGLHQDKLNLVRVIGIFIAPGANIRIGKKFELELEKPFGAIRRNVDYPDLQPSADRIYRRLKENV